METIHTPGKRKYTTRLTPEQRSERARKAGQASHSIERFAQVIADKAPELSNEQIRQLRGILAPVLASGGASE